MQKPKRNIQLRPTKHNTAWHSINLSRPAQYEALVIQMTGERPHMECNQCKARPGPFVGCFEAVDIERGRCANCHYNGWGKRCTLRLATRPPATSTTLPGPSDSRAGGTTSARTSSGGKRKPAITYVGSSDDECGDDDDDDDDIDPPAPAPSTHRKRKMAHGQGQSPQQQDPNGQQPFPGFQPQGLQPPRLQPPRALQGAQAQPPPGAQAYQPVLQIPVNHMTAAERLKFGIVLRDLGLGLIHQASQELGRPDQ